MGKGKKKKKHSLKEEVSEDVLDAAALSVRKFRKVTKEIQKLSTGQKIVGGLALLAAGLTYLAKMDLGTDEKTNDGTAKASLAPSADAPRLAHAATGAPADGPADPEPAGKPSTPRKSRKPAKVKHEN